MKQAQNLDHKSGLGDIPELSRRAERAHARVSKRRVSLQFQVKSGCVVDLGTVTRAEARDSLEFMDDFLEHAIAMPAKAQAWKQARKPQP